MRELLVSHAAQLELEMRQLLQKRLGDMERAVLLRCEYCKKRHRLPWRFFAR